MCYRAFRTLLVFSREAVVCSSRQVSGPGFGSASGGEPVDVCWEAGVKVVRMRSDHGDGSNGESGVPAIHNRRLWVERMIRNP